MVWLILIHNNPSSIKNNIHGYGYHDSLIGDDIQLYSNELKTTINNDINITPHTTNMNGGNKNNLLLSYNSMDTQSYHESSVNIPPFVSPPNNTHIYKNIYLSSEDGKIIDENYHQRNEYRRNSNGRRMSQNADLYNELSNPKLITLALKTLCTFVLHDVNMNLLFFVRETVVS